MLYLSEEEELISVSIFDINKPNLRKGKRLMSRREMNEAKAKWVRARDFIRNLEPTPLLEDFILWETPDSDPGNISFEHNVEQITEEMWGELLSLWRGIENGKKEVIVSVNTGSDYVRTILNYTVARTSDFEISDDEADPSFQNMGSIFNWLLNSIPQSFWTSNPNPSLLWVSVETLR